MNFTVQHDKSREKYIKKQADTNLFFSDKEHYGLLSTIVKNYSKVRIYDIGTYKGLSALALSSNEKNLVISYDIDYYLEISRPENVELRIGNFYYDTDILSCPLILFDIDPHNGTDERNFLDNLIKMKYKGTVIFDDIYLNDNMKKFWKSISQEKYDLTNIGHWSGTGMVKLS